MPTGMPELDRVLGGAMVRDGFVLLGGDPGIGKSTLLLQAMGGILGANPGIRALYASGEESIEQVRARARRLGVGSERAFLAAETRLEGVLASVQELKPGIVFVDSLQTFACDTLDTAPGSVGQVREVALRLMQLAKSSGIAVWLVGHVTKEGAIAGPKMVEHMVDTVLYFEGDGGLSFRILRSVKNRFGNIREIGVFEMSGGGLTEVRNPSALFLREGRTAAAGTAVSVVQEGSRFLAVELQALVVPSALAMPRRTAVGFDSARVALIAAILERFAGAQMAQQDLFFNVVGGLRLAEPASDLAAAAAIWSSFAGVAIGPDRAFIGELGLTGEVRGVPELEGRIAEAAKLGFRSACVPKSAKRIANPVLPLVTIERIADLPGLLREI